MFAIKFQDTIYGRELAAIGRGKRIANGRNCYEALKSIYVDMPNFKLLTYALEAGLITKIERNDIEEYLESDLHKWLMKRGATK